MHRVRREIRIPNAKPIREPPKATTKKETSSGYKVNTLRVSRKRFFPPEKSLRKHIFIYRGSLKLSIKPSTASTIYSNILYSIWVNECQSLPIPFTISTALIWDPPSDTKASNTLKSTCGEKNWIFNFILRQFIHFCSCVLKTKAYKFQQSFI